MGRSLQNKVGSGQDISHWQKQKKPESSREVVQEGEPPQAVLQEVNEQLQVRLPVSVSRLDVSRCWFLRDQGLMAALLKLKNCSCGNKNPSHLPWSQGKHIPNYWKKQVVDWSFGPQKQMRNHCLPNKVKDFLWLLSVSLFFGIRHKKPNKTQKTDSGLPRCFFFWFKTRFFSSSWGETPLDEPGGPGPVGVAQDDQFFWKVSKRIKLQGGVFFKGFVGF